MKKVKKLRIELDRVQLALDKEPDSEILREEEAIYLEAFTQATLDEEWFLQQRAKIKWLKEGDSKSAYFHRAVKAKQNKNRIDCIQALDGSTFEGNMVLNVFVDHFERFLFLGKGLPR